LQPEEGPAGAQQWYHNSESEPNQMIIVHTVGTFVRLSSAEGFNATEEKISVESGLQRRDKIYTTNGH